MADYGSDGEAFFVMELGSGELQLSFSGEIVELVEPTLMARRRVYLKELEEIVCDQ